MSSKKKSLIDEDDQIEFVENIKKLRSDANMEWRDANDQLAEAVG